MFAGNLKVRDRFDPDAQSYIEAVEAADGQALEAEVKVAVTRFVKGCKSDGIWNAIKASCIMAGARTLTGALTPLVGTAPTNFNFVAGDYNRKTGLKGNGSTKYLDSNRNNSLDPQNNKHICVYKTTTETSIGLATTEVLCGMGGGDNGSVNIGVTDKSTRSIFTRMHTSTATLPGQPILYAGFQGLSRQSSNNYTYRSNNSNTLISVDSQPPLPGDIFIFARNNNPMSYSAARMTYYSIGEFLDLAKLDNRITALMNAFNTYIP